MKMSVPVAGTDVKDSAEIHMVLTCVTVERDSYYTVMVSHVKVCGGVIMQKRSLET